MSSRTDRRTMEAMLASIREAIHQETALQTAGLHRADPRFVENRREPEARTADLSANVADFPPTLVETSEADEPASAFVPGADDSDDPIVGDSAASAIAPERARPVTPAPMAPPRPVRAEAGRDEPALAEGNSDEEADVPAKATGNEAGGLRDEWRHAISGILSGSRPLMRGAEATDAASVSPATSTPANDDPATTATAMTAPVDADIEADEDLLWLDETVIGDTAEAGPLGAATEIGDVRPVADAEEGSPGRNGPGRDAPMSGGAETETAHSSQERNAGPRVADAVKRQRDVESPSGETERDKGLLVTPATAARVAEAFARLDEKLSRDTFPADEERLQRSVERLLRPMLREWLDAHLPRIVERLVREEIRRIAAGRFWPREP